jgi:hypothetical protein
MEPLIFKYKGSPKGAIWSNSTRLPGKQPISNNFNGIASVKIFYDGFFAFFERMAIVVAKLI